MTTTFVTALYDIGRETDVGGDGRRWADYLEWFGATLRMSAPMVVFVPAELEEFVWARRGPKNTRVIVEPLSAAPYARHLPAMRAALAAPSYSARVRDPERIECKMPLYCVIQYSKFEWLRRTARDNPFASTSFFWVDAGVSRFVDLSTCRFPPFAAPPDRLVIQCSPDLAAFPMKGEEYLWHNQCLMTGTLFGGDRNALENVADVVEKSFDELVTQKGWLNNEQILLAWLARSPAHHHLFYAIPNPGGGGHLPLFWHLFG